MLRKIALVLVVLSLAAVGYAQAPAAKSAFKPDKSGHIKGMVPGGSGADINNDPNTVKILRTTNKAQTNRFVCETLEMRNVNPFNVINYFWAVTSREEGGIYSFASPDSNSGYIVVICPEYQLPALRALARNLDRPQLTSAPGSMYIYYRMRHRNAANPGFIAASSYYSGASGLITPDVETNSMLIFDAPAGAKAMEAAFKETLDLPLQQEELAVNVYEITVNNDGTLGLDFEAWKNGPGRLLYQYNANGAHLRARDVNTHFHASNNGIYLDYPSAYFDFLVEKGKAVSLINTKIAAVNRVPAVLTTGEQILFYEITDNNLREVHGTTNDQLVVGQTFPTNGRVVSGGNLRFPFRKVGTPDVPGDPPYPLVQAPQNGRPITSIVRNVDTGISLSIVPTIGTEMVTMDLNLKLINNEGFDDSGRPLLSSRQMTDSLAVAHGDEVIYGGLTRETRVQTTRKVPILGSIPVIGYLFGGEITTARKSVIVTVIRPTAVVNGNNVTDADNLVAKKAVGEEVVVLPPSEICFEQGIPFVANY